jgi:hypothetical protein
MRSMTRRTRLVGVRAAVGAGVVALAALGGCGSGGEFENGDSGSGGPDGSTDGTTLDGTHGSDGPNLNSDSTMGDSGHLKDSSGGFDIDLDGLTGPDEGTDGSESMDTGPTSCGEVGVTCSGSTAITCLPDGGTTSMSCSGVCAPGFGCVSTCIPGSGSCSGSTGTVCNESGSGYVTNNCDPLQGLTCMAGVCEGACADIGQSYIGCEYYAVTTANSLLDQGNFSFYVAIANTGTTPATVNIQGGALASPLNLTIPPGGIQEQELAWVPALSCGATACDAVHTEVPELEGLDPTTSPPATAIVTAGAYHIRSTQPVTVYQFNARDYAVTPTNEVSQLMSVGAYPTEYSYTNDASILIPTNALTGNYYVAGFYEWYWPAFIDIVGTQAGTTVTLSTNTTILTGSVAGLSGTGGKVTLNAGDVLQVLTGGTGGASYGGDLSGSKITASAPVEVFGGHDCTDNPAATPACDHLEQINFPLETLGNDYLVAVPYNDNELSAPAHGRQYVKIIGTVNGTTLSYDGISGEPATVNAGGVVNFEATTNFHVKASQPIEIGQYMESQQAFDTACQENESDTCGDPSESLAVATAQFRTSYPFTAPPNYEENWVNVIAPTGTTVTVTDWNSSGTAIVHTVTTGSAIGSGSGYYVANVSLCANNTANCTGNHSASSTKPFGIEVYGYGSYTSYMYPGGLNLTR